MTTANLQRPVASQAPNLMNRFASNLREFFAPGDFVALIIVTLLLMMPALSLLAADWPLARSVLLPIVALSTFMGLVLSRSRFNELLALIISTTYGVCFVVLIAATTQLGGLGDGAYELFVRGVTWTVDAATGGINQDDVIFTVLVATLFWFLGYNAAWHVFRIDRVWRVVLPPGLILVTNNVFYPGDNDLTPYLIGFMFSALVLIARSNLDAREWEWYTSGVRAPRQLRRQFMLVGSALAMLTLVLAWGAPSGNLQERLNRFQQFLQSEPLQQLSEFWNRLFSPVDAQGPTTADYYGGDTLDLGGAIRLGDQIVFQVEAPPTRRYYWRSRVFDTYESGGSWSTAADIRLTDTTPPFDVIANPQNARVSVQQTFTMGLNASRLVYTAPQPSQVDLSTRSDLRYVPNREDPNVEMNISVIRPTEVIRRGESYTVTSLMSTATADQLRAAPTTYPQWVNDLYLYVTPAISTRTLQLSDNIVETSGAVTPYDKAKAIEAWLRANIVYSENIPQPPDDRDPIDWLLFDLREGYCNYYASAMVVMLRRHGIPARMAAGFAQGTWDADQNAYVVTERDAHTWVEAYFPGYGWIEFEPTAAQAPLNRDGDQESPVEQVAPPAQVTPTLEPTSTPLPTSTPMPTPTDQADNTEPDDGNPPTPTIAPTATPTPTATPVIIPTQPAPVNPPPRTPLSFILPALGLALFGLLMLIVIAAIGLFIYWWWEWRGMKGLSPVSRAYARLERYIPLIGIRFKPEQTPEERRYSVMRGLPSAERPVTYITRTYMNERYGPGERHPAEAQHNSQRADKAWSNARGKVLQRWLNRFIPWRRNR